MAITKELIKTIEPADLYGLDLVTIYCTQKNCSNLTSSNYSLGIIRLKKNRISTLNLAISVGTLEQTSKYLKK